MNIINFEKLKNNGFISYKDKPLVRCKNTIYYGNPLDKYVIKMTINQFEDKYNLKISSKICVDMIQLSNGTEKSYKLIKTSEKYDLYSAMDLADIWLKRAEISL